MRPQIPAEIEARARCWGDLKLWERRELGQKLRTLGLSYNEIAKVIPVSKGTLSGWCRDLELSPDQRDRLRSIRPDNLLRLEIGQRRRRKNDLRIANLRESARCETVTLIGEPLWLAGTIAYWAEGTKTSRELQFSNSDPAMVRLFIRWAEQYLRIERFSIQLHLHSGQDEMERRRFWSLVTGMPLSSFRKTFIKQEGTGHRKKVLYHGTVSIRARRSGEAFHRVMGWIEGISENLGPLAQSG